MFSQHVQQMHTDSVLAAETDTHDSPVRFCRFSCFSLTQGITCSLTDWEKVYTTMVYESIKKNPEDKIKNRADNWVENKAELRSHKVKMYVFFFL